MPIWSKLYLKGANLHGANLDGTSLKETNLNGANLTKAQYSSSTSFPFTLNPISGWHRVYWPRTRRRPRRTQRD
ncbi:MAG: pentapeptide repeat-containing protein [Cyanobacteria bacterium P01_H01_bin.15]